MRWLLGPGPVRAVTGFGQRVRQRYDVRAEHRRERKLDLASRRLHATRPTPDLRLLPVGLLAWGTALVTASGSLVGPPSPTGWALLLGTVALTTVLLLLVARRTRWKFPWSTVALCALVASAVAAGAWQHHDRVQQEHGEGVGIQRLQFEVTDRPIPWNSRRSDPRGSSGESSSGVVVPVRTETGLEATVFATDSRWRTVAADDVVEALATPGDGGDGALTYSVSGAPTVTGSVRGTGLMGWLDGAKDRFMAAAQPHGTDSASLMPGMTYGDRSSFDSGLEQSMKDTGLTHLTAVSGSNCALVMILAGHLALSFGASRRVCVLSGVGALGVFVLLVGPDPSVLRAAVMGSVGAAGILVGRGGTSLAALSAAMAGLLVVDPRLGTDFGFALSVCATAGIIVTGRPLVRLLERFLPTLVATLIAIPVVAQLWCAAVLTMLTPTVAVWSVPANALVAPVVPVVTVIGLLALVAFGIGGGPLLVVGQALMWLGSVPVAGVAAVARYFAGLPGAVLPWWEPPVGPAIMALICAAVILVIHRLDARGRRQPTWGSLETKPSIAAVPEEQWLRAKRIRRRYVTAAAALTVACGVVVAVQVLARDPPRTDWRAVMCDVGQGDALLLRGSSGGQPGESATVLIDAGPDPSALRRCVKTAGVEAIDLLILTHDHADHVAGADGLQDYVEIREVWYSSGTGRPPQEIGAWQVPGERPPPGTVYQRAGMTVEALGPLTDPQAAVDSSGENNASLAIRAELTGNDDGAGPAATMTVFAAGDLQEEGASSLIKTYGAAPGGVLDVDVLKVSHHGARNGGTAIIEATSPHLALISVGADNDYGHPNSQITAHLSSQDVPVVRTDQAGSVELFIDDDARLRVETTR